MFSFHKPEISTDAQIFFPPIGHSSPHVEAIVSGSAPLMDPPAVVDSIHMTSKPPGHLKDYHCYAVNSSTAHPISNVLSYDAFSDPYMIIINAVNSIHSCSSTKVQRVV